LLARFEGVAQAVPLGNQFANLHRILAEIASAPLNLVGELFPRTEKAQGFAAVVLANLIVLPVRSVGF
jgi:hypothetical protein